MLTVLAKNRGNIIGNDIDEAQIIIQVQDGNDPPVFRKLLYTSEVDEDSPIGTEVMTVSAIDKDNPTEKLVFSNTRSLIRHTSRLVVIPVSSLLLEN